MGTRSAHDASKLFEKMIERVQLRENCFDKGRSLRELSNHFATKRTSTRTRPQIKWNLLFLNESSVLWKTFYKQLENRQTYHQINRLHSFVNTMISWVNRVTRLAPSKVTERHLLRLVSLAAEQLTKFVSKPRFAIGNKVQQPRKSLAFQKMLHQFHWRNFCHYESYPFHPTNILSVEWEKRDHQKKILRAGINPNNWMNLLFTSNLTIQWVFTPKTQ